MTTPHAYTDALQCSLSSPPSSSFPLPVPSSQPASVQSDSVPPLTPLTPPTDSTLPTTVDRVLSEESTPAEIYAVCTTWELLGSYCHLASVRRLKQCVTQYCSKNHLYRPHDAFKQHCVLTCHPDRQLSRGQLLLRLDYSQQQHATLLQQHEALEQSARDAQQGLADAQQSVADAQHRLSDALRELDELRQQLVDERREASRMAERHARLVQQHGSCAQLQSEACARLYDMHHHSTHCTKALLNNAKVVDDHAIDLALTWLNGESRETMFVSALAMQTADVDLSLPLIDSRLISTGRVVVKVVHYSVNRINHWAVAVWDRSRENVVFTIDSATLVDAATPQLVFFIDWVQAVRAHELGRPAEPLTVEQVECAQQDDTVSCGLYVVEFCKVLAKESIMTRAAQEKLMECKVTDTRQFLFHLYTSLQPSPSAKQQVYEHPRKSKRKKTR